MVFMVGSECRNQYVHIRNHRSAASRRDRLQEPSMPDRKPPRRGETGNGFMVPPRGAAERRRRTSPSSTTAARVVRSLAACARAWASNSSRMSTVAFTTIIVPRIPPRSTPFSLQGGYSGMCPLIPTQRSRGRGGATTSRCLPASAAVVKVAQRAGAGCRGSRRSAPGRTGPVNLTPIVVERHPRRTLRLTAAPMEWHHPAFYTELPRDRQGVLPSCNAPEPKASSTGRALVLEMPHRHVGLQLGGDIAALSAAWEAAP